MFLAAAIGLRKRKIYIAHRLLQDAEILWTCVTIILKDMTCWCASSWAKQTETLLSLVPREIVALHVEAQEMF